MRVRKHAQSVLKTMQQAGIPATIIKGPDFADALYTDPRSRPTLDVDLMVPRDHWQRAIQALEATGHHEKPGQPGPFVTEGVLSERTWLFPAAGAPIEVDLHWSLVHFPYFRKQASLDYWNLDWHWLAGTGGKGELTAASRVVIAAVHVLYHHQFERLIQLIDIQHACRNITNDAQQQALRALVERTGTKLSFDVALRVASRFLDDPAIEALRQTICDGSGHPGIVPEGLFEDARKNLRTIRTNYLSPGRVRIRQWLLTQPMRPEPGWELRPATPAPPGRVVSFKPPVTSAPSANAGPSRVLRGDISRML